jgi:hypothetical protein
MGNDAWRGRLRAALDESGKSDRAVSLAAKCGPGYVHSIFKEGKEPTIDKLMAVCAAVPVSLPYVLYGVDVEPEDFEILRAMHDNPDARAAILAILRAR